MYGAARQICWDQQAARWNDPLAHWGAGALSPEAIGFVLTQPGQLLPQCAMSTVWTCGGLTAPLLLILGILAGVGTVVAWIAVASRAAKTALMTATMAAGLAVIAVGAGAAKTVWARHEAATATPQASLAHLLVKEMLDEDPDMCAYAGGVTGGPPLLGSGMGVVVAKRRRNLPKVGPTI